jgi:hypothetical protein
MEQVLFNKLILESVVSMQRNLEAVLLLQQLKNLHIMLLARLSPVAVLLCFHNLVSVVLPQKIKTLQN